jgi:hypothetical protein
MASFFDKLKDWVSGVENEKLDIEGVDLPEVPRKSSLDLGADEVLDALGFGSPSEEEIATAITPKAKQEQVVDSDIVEQSEEPAPLTKKATIKQDPKKEVQPKLSDDTVLPTLPGTYETKDQSTQEDAPELSPQEKLLDELRSQKAEFGEKLKESQKKDKWISLLEAGLPFLQQYVQGTTGTKTGLPTVAKPIKLDLDPLKTSKNVMKEREQALEDMLTEYKLGKKDIKYTKDRVFEITPEGEVKILKEFEQKLSPLQKQKLLEYGKTQNRKLKDQEMRFNKNLYGVVKDFENDKLNTELKKQGIAFDQATSLMDTMKMGNEIALGSLGTKMARAMGEVGVLTDADVSRYITAVSAANKVRDKFGRVVWGKLSDKTTKDLSEVINMMKSGFSSTKDKLLEKYIDRAHRNFGKHMDLSREEVASRFGEELGISAKSQELNKKDQQALDWAKKNPEKEQSQKILNTLGSKYGRQF